MNKKAKLTLIVLTAGFLLCTAAYVILVTVFTDMNTGFLHREYRLAGNLLFFGIGAAAAAAAIFTARADSKNGLMTENFSGGKTAVLGILMLVMALCAAFEGVSEIKAFSPSIFLMVSDFAGAAAMAVIGFVTLSSKIMKPGVGFSYSFAALYFVAKAIYSFIDRMVITAVPEYLTGTLAVAFGAVFLALTAKVLSGNGEKNTKSALCFWGVGTVVLNLSSGIGIMLSKLIAPTEISSMITPSVYRAEEYYETTAGGYMMTFMPYVNLALGVFAAAFIIMLFVRGNTPAEVSEVPAGTESSGDGSAE